MHHSHLYQCANNITNLFKNMIGKVKDLTLLLNTTSNLQTKRLLKTEEMYGLSRS